METEHGAAAAAGGLQCNEACGFIAAFIGALCYGTYGVPLKLTAKHGLDCHPLVLQTYKTAIFFVLSWNVLIFEPGVRWTPYGILGGLLWVVGGSCGCAAILYAGITTAVGTWASMMIIVNFFWGIMVFHEPVHSMTSTIGAFVCLILGLLGMTKFASPPAPGTSSYSASPSTSGIDDGDDDCMELLPTKIVKRSKHAKQYQRRTVVSRSTSNAMHAPRLKKDPVDDDLTIILLEDESDNSVDAENDQHEDNGDGDDDMLGKLLGPSSIVHVLAGYTITRRQAGIVFAVLNGLIAGSSLVPLHYAKLDGFTHMSYLISFASGAVIANVGIWTTYFGLQYAAKCGDLSAAWDQIPKFHFFQIWQKMLLAGILLSGGQLGAILATSSLGQAVGNSLIQSKILISGIWGLCVFREVTNRRAVTKWFLSALVGVASILWLSYEKAAAHTAGPTETVET
jgi:glucose uptake protein GlcU